MKIIRQGDVAFVPTNKIQGEVQKINKYGHVLVEGESTFHNHILEKGNFYKLPQESDTGVIGTIEIENEPVDLIHFNIQTKELTKEHEKIQFIPQELPSKIWKVLRQFEYWPEGYKKIAD